MSGQSQSPQRSRKTQQQHAGVGVGAGVSGPAQTNVRREPSPSPSVRERQRYNRAQSMPIVSPLTQIHGQSSPTAAAHQQKLQRSSPLAHDSTNHLQDEDEDDDSERPAHPPHPPLTHSHSFSQPSVSLQQQQQAQAQSQSQPPGSQAQYPQLGFPRPVARVPPPQFLAQETWQMTEDLEKDIVRADLLMQHQKQPAAPGTQGVAYAGGAASFARFQGNSSPPKGGAAESQAQSQSQVQLQNQTVDDAGHASAGSAGRRPTMTQRRRSGSRPLTPDLNAPNPNQQQHHQQQRTSPTNASSTLSLATPRKAGNASPTFAGAPSPGRMVKSRTPDRSLPVQEEPDEHEHERPDKGVRDVGGSSPLPSSDLDPYNRSNDRDRPHDPHGEGTLVDVGDDLRAKIQAASSGESTEGDDGTPRSPDNMLFEHSHKHVQETRTIHGVLQGDGKSNGKPVQEQQFSSATFQQTLKKLQDDNGRQNGNINGNGNHAHNQNTMNAERVIRQHLPQTFVPVPIPVFSRNESRGSYPNWFNDFYQNYAMDEGEFYEVDEAAEAAAAFMQQYMPTSGAGAGTNNSNGSHNSNGSNGSLNSQSSHNHARPDAPIPPTPHSQTAASTPFQQNHHGGANAAHEPMPRALIPPFSPAPPGGTPYPYPFAHVRRGFAYPTRPPGAGAGGMAAGPRVTSSVYDPSVVQEQIALQMQMYAYNNGGAVSDSTLSPSSTPYPGMGPTYNPFSAFLSQSRGFGRGMGFGYAQGNGAGMGQAYVNGAGGADDVGNGPGDDGRLTAASMRSSPSHEPVPLPMPPMRGRGIKKREHFSNLRGHHTTAAATGPIAGAGVGRGRVKPPPRVESTQPRDTSPEPSSGEETAGEKLFVDLSQTGSADSGGWGSGDGVVRVDEENGEWVDEDSEDEHDLLDLEFHPSYVSNMGRRRKKWDQRWDDLVKAFQALDRETDATLVLLASPSHTNTLHSLSSRSIRRDASLFDGHPMNNIKTSFGQIASQRRSARSQRISLLERLYATSNTGDSSPSSTVSREEDLRRALKTAIDSLGAMRQMYEMREARWRDEERRMSEEREGMDMLLQQAFGAGFINHGIGHAM